MRRRIKAGQVPPMLATFTPADWPGRTVEDKLAIWKEARRAWHDEHGWPGGPLAMLRGSSDVQRRLDGRRLLPWGRSPAELARLNGAQSPASPRPPRSN